MKLILAFSELSFELNSQDVVVYGHKIPLEKEDCSFIDVNECALNEKKLSEYFDDFLLRASVSFDSELTGILAGCNNNLYTNHLSVFKWVAAIDSVFMNNSVDEVVVTDLVDDSGYAPYYEAEGEAHSRFFYKPYDFIPKVLERYIKNKYNVNEHVLRRRFRIGLLYRKIMRRYFLLLFKFVFYFAKSRSYKYLFQNKSNGRSVPIENFIVSRSIAHFDSVSLLHKGLDNSLLFCGESGFTFGDNYRFSSKNTSDVVGFSSYLTSMDLVRSFVFVVKQLLLKPKGIAVEYEGVEYSYSDAVTEMIVSSFEVDLLERAIINFIEGEGISNNCILYTCEMYTPFTRSIANLGGVYGVKTVQLQTTSMFVGYEPNFVHCDYFVFNSKVLANSYASKYPSRRGAGIYLGNFCTKRPDRAISLSSSGVRNVMYFTQPLTDEDIEQEIICELVRLGDLLGFKLKIKLHPRDSVKKIESFLNEVSVVDSCAEFDEYIVDVDLVVLKTSTIAAKAVISGVPVLYCLFSEWARNGKLDYIDHTYFGSIRRLNDIEDRLRSFVLLFDDFIRYRDSYLLDNDLYSGVEDFLLEYKSTL